MLGCKDQIQPKEDFNTSFFDKKDLVYLVILWLLTLSTVFFAVKYDRLKKTTETCLPFEEETIQRRMQQKRKMTDNPSLPLRGKVSAKPTDEVF